MFLCFYVFTILFLITIHTQCTVDQTELYTQDISEPEYADEVDFRDDCDLILDWDIIRIGSDIPCSGVRVVIENLSIVCDGCEIAQANFSIDAYRTNAEDLLGEKSRLFYLQNEVNANDVVPNPVPLTPFGSDKFGEIVVEPNTDTANWLEFDIIPTTGFANLVVIEVCLEPDMEFECVATAECDPTTCLDDLSNQECVRKVIACN